MEQPMDVLRNHPVRKSKKQKTAFIEDVLTYGATLGYQTAVEQGSFHSRNIVLGDPEQAQYVITAHYDTCAALPFPNLITPRSFWLFLGWQLLLVAILCLPVGILGGLIGSLLDNPVLAVDVAYLLLLGEMALMLFGPANKHNANDNTSGVVTLLETAKMMPDELRERVCFVLFDLEEAGLIGSASYRKRHRNATSRQTILNLDCVGEGDEIFLFPTKKLKKNAARTDAFRNLCRTAGEKSLTVADQGFAIYPSDQSNFPVAMGIAAFCRSKWAGLYLEKIHTKRDTHLDENNVAVLCDYLISVIRQQA